MELLLSRCLTIDILVPKFSMIRHRMSFALLLPFEFCSVMLEGSNMTLGLPHEMEQF